MTLALGTALQQGHYVIDALAMEDGIGPLYLATHISQGRQVLVRVLGSRQPQNIPPATQRSAFFSYLQAVQALGLSLLPKQFEGFEEEGVCYQVLSLPDGSPLSQQVNPDRPLNLSQALALLKVLTDSLQALRPLGWLGLCFQPDQIWWAPDQSAPTWIGFDLPSHPQPPQEETERMLVKQLGYLLYFLLTGYDAAHTQAPLEVDLCHRHPGLPASLVSALRLATDPQPTTLNEWVEPLLQLQSVTTAMVYPGSGATNGYRSSGSGQPPLRQPQIASTPTRVAPPITVSPIAKGYGPKRWSQWATLGLIVTAMGAGLIGLMVGLELRMQTVGSSGASRFNPNQSFPPLANWNGNRTGTKVLGPLNRRLRQPDYGDAPRPTPAHSPTLARPLPAVVPASPVPAPSALPSPLPAHTLSDNPASLPSDGSLSPALGPNSAPVPAAIPTPTPMSPAEKPAPSVGSDTTPKSSTVPPPPIAPAPPTSSPAVNL